MSQYFFTKKNLFIQIVDERLFSGSVDGTLKVWDVTGLKGDIMPELKSTGDQSKFTNGDRISAENRSDVDSGIDDREYRSRRAQNMVQKSGTNIYI